MGQQQIIILVLVLAIVVLGILLGTQFFRTANVQFTESEYDQYLLETAELFQATYEKPEMFGGGGHHWNKVNFNNVPCTFGEANDNRGKACSLDRDIGSFTVLVSGHTTYVGLLGLAHIGGKGVGNMYTRELRVYADSVVFSTEWINH